MPQQINFSAAFFNFLCVPSYIACLRPCHLHHLTTNKFTSLLVSSLLFLPHLLMDYSFMTSFSILEVPTANAQLLPWKVQCSHLSKELCFPLWQPYSNQGCSSLFLEQNTVWSYTTCYCSPCLSRWDSKSSVRYQSKLWNITYQITYQRLSNRLC